MTEIRAPGKLAAARRRHQARSGGALWRVRATMFASALLQIPSPAAAQDASAWWARVNLVDDAVRCPAMLAWLRAIEVERRDHEQATTEQLADVATGPELAREQQQLGTAAPQAQHQWAEYSSWTVMGGTSQEVVIYATSIVRAGPADATGNEMGDAEWVETVQAAYRMVLENGAWRLADRHLFERERHTVNHGLGITVVQQYQRLFEGLTDAYNARNDDALKAVLDGAALDQYRDELRQQDDQQDHRTVQYTGQLGIIDVRPSRAVAAFEGTRTYTEANSARGAEANAQTEQPVTLIHRLELVDGEWKIVNESEATARRDAHGTQHVDGCT
jgi:hypothetical protein